MFLQLTVAYQKQFYNLLDKCFKNQLNLVKVQFKQRTRSQCHIERTYLMKKVKYKDIGPTAIERRCIAATKNDCIESVKKRLAIWKIMLQNMSSVDNNQMSSVVTISEVLPQLSKFLQNVAMMFLKLPCLQRSKNLRLNSGQRRKKLNFGWRWTRSSCRHKILS